MPDDLAGEEDAHFPGGQSGVLMIASLSDGVFSLLIDRSRLWTPMP